MDLANAIRNAREDQGIMVSEVARRAGLTTAGVMAIESGRVRNPGIETVVKIAHALGVDVGELLKEEASSNAPKVVALPSTPVTDIAPSDLDERLRSAESAAQADRILRDLEAEARDLEEFFPRHVAQKLDRARLYAAAARDRWLKLADDRRDPASNRFKTVSEVAGELGGRYKAFSSDPASHEVPRENSA
jgi:transcriptional regulator with XRE-family HTH domain